ncbi:MAG: anthranilate synthase component I family protein [Candidatus Peregrinibacteria bacterium]|nr:anthranilate synthase component I family protein [Candidatus Peregrinibacteria bacterium]
MQTKVGKLKISITDPKDVFSKIYQDYKYKFLFESKDVSQIYGRLSMIGIDPILKITGKNKSFEVEVLNKRGHEYLKQLNQTSQENGNISMIIKHVLKTFKTDEKTLLGLYGTFSYDFVRLFEDIGDSLPDNDINDFTLLLYDTFIFFDHLKDNAEIIVYRKNKKEIKKDIEKISNKLNKQPVNPEYRIKNPYFSFSEKQYEGLVKTAKLYTKKGDLFEVVFSNILKAEFEGDPFGLYLRYRKENPSPYLFFFDLGHEQLVGASPEMMVRYENGIVNLRPISGTIKRGENPIEDHENMLKLLMDPKEKAELDMLIDLGRNDLSRVCKPGIKITDYRFVEKYSKVMHTVANLSGELQEGRTALDALIACLNAGTLTGAPKVAAMKIIEKHEKERRGYYGGTIGYLTFSGEMDTGIIIRTAHIKNGQLRFQVGATLLNDSKPKKEYQETINKAQAFLNTFI